MKYKKSVEKVSEDLMSQYENTKKKILEYILNVCRFMAIVVFGSVIKNLRSNVGSSS